VETAGGALGIDVRPGGFVAPDAGAPQYAQNFPEPIKVSPHALQTAMSPMVARESDARQIQVRKKAPR
jgi:hypothetical protein